MKKIYTLFAIVFLNFAFLNSQSLKLFDVDISGFPFIKAKFIAMDANNNPISNLNIDDFEVRENNIKRTVSFLECPPMKTPEALSTVMVMDASGSMAGKNLTIAKEAARAWINGLMNPKSEVAINTFESRISLLIDFTTDKSRLLSIIDKYTQNPSGFTDYDLAMLSSPYSGVPLSYYGKYKRVVLFLTDGKPTNEPQTEKIIDYAHKLNTIIYAVSIRLSAPQSLKDMANLTGGKWFENVDSEEKIREIYLSILEKEQNASPCEIVWESSASCKEEFYNAEIKLKTNNTSAKYAYQMPASGVMKITYFPQNLEFLNAKPGVKVNKFITLTARNADFNVTDITSTNPAFTISPTSFQLKKNQTIDLTVSFTPVDSGYITTKIDIYNDKCPANFTAYGGFPGKHPFVQTLKIIHPNGGEVFPAGMDTVITWDGVLPTEKVRIEYSTNNGQTWILIDENASGLKYKWTVPKTPSNNCIARVTTKEKYHGFDDDWVLITNKTKRYWVSRYEVTQKQYSDVMLTNPSFFKGDDLPVEQVSWYDAINFCNRLSELNGLKPCYTNTGNDVTFDVSANGYRLPTDAEWEFACRANTVTHIYSGNIQDIYNINCGILAANLDKIGWYCANSGSKTHRVGTKEKNSFNLFDMSGNVYEWVWDWKDSQQKTEKLLRGGSWNAYAEYCKSGYKHFHFPNYTSSEFGFRLVKNY